MPHAFSNVTDQNTDKKPREGRRCYKIIFLAFCFFFYLLSVGHTAHAAPPAGYALSWGDDFDSLSLDPTCTGSGGTWATYFCGYNVRYLSGNSDDGIKMDDTWKGNSATSGSPTIQQVLTNAGWSSPSLHEVSGGTLKLRGYPIPSQYQAQFTPSGVNVASSSAASMITSEKTHWQMYGYWEVRARLNQPPKNKHFSFWLLAKDGIWPPEIDLLETVIDHNDVTESILSSVGYVGTPSNVYHPYTATGGMLGVWHTYGFEWTPTTLNWYVDGQLMYTHANTIFKPMYFLATWEQGGNWEGNTDSNTPWPAEMEVDYVHVYAYPSGQATSPSPSDSASNVINTSLAWTGDVLAAQHAVYLGTSSSLGVSEYKGSYDASILAYTTGTLAPNTTYYWRIDEINGAGTTTGPVWSFTTGTTRKYNPGETLDPSCLPTDSNCGIESGSSGGISAIGVAGQVPYYALSGTTLTATSAVTILANGKVGIGSTTPSSLLSVGTQGIGSGNTITLSGPTAGRDLTISNKDASPGSNGSIEMAGGNLSVTGGYDMYLNAKSHNLYLQTGGTNRLTVQATTGNVGIGTTSPYAKLSVAGTVVAGIFNATTSTSTFAGINLTSGCFAINNTCITGGGTPTIVGTSTINFGNLGQVAFYPADGTAVSGTSTLFISSSGKVGIGTTSPATQLDVWGNFQIGTSSTALIFANPAANYVGIGRTTPAAYGLTPKLEVVGGIQVDSSNSASGNIVYIGSGQGSSPGTSDVNRLRYGGNAGANTYFTIQGPSNVDMMTFRGDKVGIGTTSPYAKLTVWGRNDIASTFAVVDSASTTLFQIFNDGNATLSGSLTQNSDQRLKTHIQSLDASSSLDAIMNLDPVSFTWIDPAQDQTPRMGFIAQEVQKIFPELVSTTSATRVTPDGTLGLNYIGLIAPMVESIKELARQVQSFAQSVTTVVVNATTGNFSHVKTEELCVGSNCVTEEQLKTLLRQTQQRGAVSETTINITSETAIASTTLSLDTSSTTTETEATSTESASTTTTDLSAEKRDSEETKNDQTDAPTSTDIELPAETSETPAASSTSP